MPDEHDYNELGTRKLIIDVLLAEAGWTVGGDASEAKASEEFPVTGMPNGKGEGFADYVLWGENGLPLAVVEAKRTLRDPEVGKQQAKLYADCLEAMKGQRPLIFYTNGYQTWLWDDCRAAPRQVQGFYSREELALAIRRRTIAEPAANHPVKDAIAERYYQKRAIASLCDVFERGSRRGLLAMATGAGKTRTAIALVDVLMRANRVKRVKRVLFLADRIALVKQVANAFKDHLPDAVTVNLVTERNTDGRVYVSTYPTMMGLIDKGLGEEGGDRLGKTIVFARNNDHARFIAERFDQHYPEYNGHFARMITYQVNYAQSLIETFEVTDKLPQIAISVDMLDTGIDVPDVVNLVFFKPVRSKVKFLQVIGRGTWLRPDLFGPGRDKEEFRIFDYCENFEFFNEQAAGADAAPAEPLHKRLFLQRLDLLARLPGADTTPGVYDEPAPIRGDIQADNELRAALKHTLYAEVAAMNLANFIVRAEREHVERFQKPGAWTKLSDEAQGTLAHHVAGLLSTLKNNDITARLFDLTCLNLQIATLDQEAARRAALIERIQSLAHGLETAANIPDVKAQLELIHAVQGDEYWQDATLPMIDNVRRRLRGLIQHVKKNHLEPVYSALDDELGEGVQVTLGSFQTGVNLAQYRRKVETFIRANEQQVAIAKLKHNRPLTPSDLAELEQFV